jgi:hypothetical protein
MQRISKLVIGSLLVSFLAVAPLAVSQAQSSQFLLTVAFNNVDFIRTGELANYTGPYQLIGFSVFPTLLVNENTQQSLLNGPDAFFAVRAAAIASDDPARSTQYCLDMIREIAFAPAAGAKLILFLNVTHVTGTNFVVDSFDSCELQLPRP